MNTKEAAQKFGMDVKNITRICRSNSIPNAEKIGSRWEIPDNLNLIMTREDCVSVLTEIVKCRNHGDNYPINRRLFPDDEKCEFVMDYLYNLGYLAEYDKTGHIEIKDMQVTDAGFDLLFGKKKNTSSFVIHFSLSFASKIQTEMDIKSG